MPVSRIEPVPQDSAEDLKLADHELERSDPFSRLPQGGAFRLKSGDASTQRRKPGFELLFFNDAFGIAVDQALDAPAKLGDLAADGIGFTRLTDPSRRLQTPLILIEDAGRIAQHVTHLVPDRRVEDIDRDARTIASALAIEPLALGSTAPIIPVMVLCLA